MTEIVNAYNRARRVVLALLACSSFVVSVHRIALAQRPDLVNVTVNGSEVEVSIAGKLFTRYTMLCAPNKPVFYPILTDDGRSFTRRWPVEPNASPAESHDHVHHRGLWFTHSSVNGIDFWSEEGKNIGKTITTRIGRHISGTGHGSFHADTEWRAPNGALIATDSREVTITALPNGGRYLDFDITIKPVGGPLLFGDNKDGAFGLRLPDSLAVHPAVKPPTSGTGHILNSDGIKDSEAWGKRANWVDYWGPIDNETYGVAMFDSPTNVRHPQTWHARDYSLFTVNPFGLHDFGMGPKGTGDLTVKQDGRLRLTYRLYFHRGNAEEANVAEKYRQYAGQ
jgi:hypothetical protein